MGERTETLIFFLHSSKGNTSYFQYNDIHINSLEILMKFHIKLSLVNDNFQLLTSTKSRQIWNKTCGDKNLHTADSLPLSEGMKVTHGRTSQPRELGHRNLNILLYRNLQGPEEILYYYCFSTSRDSETLKILTCFL